MKIGFLFMIYNKLEKEDLWYMFFKDIPKDKYSLYIHSKYTPEFENSFFNNFIIPERHDTEWGTYSLVNVQNKLFKKAFDDDCYKYIILSDTHIPLHTFDFIYNFLTQNNNSYVYSFIIKKNSSIYNERFKSINNIKKYNIDNFMYGNQWNILNKDHVEFLLTNEKEFEEIFKNSVIPDEYAYLNYFRENNKISMANIKTTFISPARSYDKKYRPFPHTFDLDELNYNLLRKIKSSYLFMRKVVHSCNVLPEWIFYDIDKFKLNSKIIKI